MQANRMPEKGRFSMLDSPTTKDGSCLLWNGNKTTQGYGLITFNGTLVLAHRFVYKLLNPEEDISDKVIMHSCDNPSCVNPEHLSSGTQSDNIKDCSEKGRWGKYRTAKLTEDQAKEIKYSLLPPRYYTELYGIGKTTVSAIRRGISWRHI